MFKKFLICVFSATLIACNCGSENQAKDYTQKNPPEVQPEMFVSPDKNLVFTTDYYEWVYYTFDVKLVNSGVNKDVQVILPNGDWGHGKTDCTDSLDLTTRTCKVAIFFSATSDASYQADNELIFTNGTLSKSVFITTVRRYDWNDNGSN